MLPSGPFWLRLYSALAIGGIIWVVSRLISRYAYYFQVWEHWAYLFRIVDVLVILAVIVPIYLIFVSPIIARTGRK